jgi:predicted AAA+ superfamily ATPase
MLDFKKLILDENPRYQEDSLNESEDSSFIKKIKRRYPEITKFKKVMHYDDICERLKPFIKFIKNNPEKTFDVILNDPLIYADKEEYSDAFMLHSFTILDEDFAFVYKKDHKKQLTMASYLFFNDYEILKNKLFCKDFRKYSPGIYELKINKSNYYYLAKLDLKYIEEPIFEEETLKKLNLDVDTFYNNRDFYFKNNLPRKRGIIIHGPHGNGKTTAIKNIVSKYSDSYRVIIDCKMFNYDLSDFLLDVFPEDGNKIIIFEDVESISEGDDISYGKRSSFLNFIDGAKTLNNTLFIATTNYPELIDKALIDRPSRFDKIYQIDLPNSSSRKKFLLKYFPDLHKDPNLEDYVDKTKDFSGAYFKELFILVGIQKCSIEEAISDLKKQIKKNKTKNYNSDKNLGLNS